MNATGQETMSMMPAITGQQMIAITVLTLFFLAAGVFIGALCGDLSMRPLPADRNDNVTWTGAAVSWPRLNSAAR